MNYYEIVKKLIGEVHPVGSSEIDKARYENLRELTGLAEEIIEKIYEVSKEKGRHEFSISRAGKHASKFLERLKKSI